MPTGVYTVNAPRNGTDDDAVYIQDAIDAANSDEGGVVMLPTGRYYLKSQITMRSGVSLVGAGPRATRLLQAQWTTNPFVATGFYSSPVALTADALPGSLGGEGGNRISVASSSGFAFDDIVLVSSDAYISERHQSAGLAGHRKGELLRVYDVPDSTTVTLSPGGYYGWGLGDEYRVADNATIRKVVSSMPRGFGMYDLSVESSGWRSHYLDADNKAIMVFTLCRDVTFHNVHFKRLDQWVFQFISCFGVVVSDCVFEDLSDNSATAFGYGVAALNATTGLVMSGCTGRRLRHLFTTGTGFGVYGQPTNCLIQGCIADECWISTAFDTHEGGLGIVFDGCLARNTWGGFQSRAKGTVFSSCHAFNCNAYGFLLAAESHGSKIIGGSAKGCEVGVIVANTRRAVVKDMVIDGSAWQGVWVTDLSNIQAQQTTIVFDTAGQLEFSGNRIWNCGQNNPDSPTHSPAILIDVPATKVLVRNNTAGNSSADESFPEPDVAGKTGFLVSLEAAADDIHVSNNILVSSDSSAGVVASVVSNTGGATNVTDTGNTIWAP